MQICQRETEPDKCRPSARPFSLFSQRVRAGRRSLSAEGKPTLSSTKEEIHEDMNRSSVLLPRLRSYLPSGKSLLENPLAMSL